MANFAISLLAILPLASGLCLPAGEAKEKRNVLDAREITISTLPPTTSYSTAIKTMQSATVSETPSLTGSILTQLPSGGFTKDPLGGPGQTLTSSSLIPNETPLNPGPTEPVQSVAPDIFQPVADGGPPPSIPWNGSHIVQKRFIVDEDEPTQTNKFYANFFLGSQGSSVWTHPYSLSWAKGMGNSYGMAISHIERGQLAFGGGPSPDQPQYFIGPIGIQHMVLSAYELGSDTYMSIEDLQAFSVSANFAASQTSRVLMSLPVVQGMGMITALYDRAMPILSTGVFFRTLDYVQPVHEGRSVTHKYRIQLNDGSQWLLYVTPTMAAGVPPFTLINSTTIAGPRDFVGMVQVTKNPAGLDGEAAFDGSAGAYAANTTISGSTDGSTGTYTLSWGKRGVQSQTLLMYALPHHVESFDQVTQSALRPNISLVTTTKGYATAVQADRMTMIEDDLPDTMGFGPWIKAPNGGTGGSENTFLNNEARALVNEAGIAELSQDFDSQTRLNSMYYSGKGLAKFASIIYTVNSMGKNSQYAAAGLDKLKDAFDVFVRNTQPEPLLYDTVWKGVVSSASYRPPYDAGLDFGNTLYNDHHFHYGYFVYTAAVIGHLQPEWLNEGTNKAWVNTLVRDYANPVNDAYFPFSRAFDWFHGHSWAKGLFESGDGKDEESTSEDAFATYALKMWGKVIGDANMEARGNLQLAIQARSFRNYFLLAEDNPNQPPQFLHNRVTGILFENKVDHTTYFGTNIEYIEGIHMLPLNPSSAYTRPKQFVQQEWDQYFSNGRADSVQGGWKSLLYANLALIDPQASYQFFSDPNFSTDLDGGASRTWYLAYSAAMMAGGGSQSEASIADTDDQYDYYSSEQTQSQDQNDQSSYNDVQLQDGNSQSNDSSSDYDWSDWYQDDQSTATSTSTDDATTSLDSMPEASHYDWSQWFQGDQTTHDTAPAEGDNTSQQTSPGASSVDSQDSWPQNPTPYMDNNIQQQDSDMQDQPVISTSQQEDSQSAPDQTQDQSTPSDNDWQRLDWSQQDDQTQDQSQSYDDYTDWYTQDDSSEPGFVASDPPSSDSQSDNSQVYNEQDNRQYGGSWQPTSPEVAQPQDATQEPEQWQWSEAEPSTPQAEQPAEDAPPVDSEPWQRKKAWPVGFDWPTKTAQVSRSVPAWTPPPQLSTEQQTYPTSVIVITDPAPSPTPTPGGDEQGDWPEEPQDSPSEPSPDGEAPTQETEPETEPSPTLPYSDYPDADADANSSPPDSEPEPKQGDQTQDQPEYQYVPDYDSDPYGEYELSCEDAGLAKDSTSQDSDTSESPNPDDSSANTDDTAYGPEPVQGEASPSEEPYSWDTPSPEESYSWDSYEATPYDDSYSKSYDYDNIDTSAYDTYQWEDSPVVEVTEETPSWGETDDYPGGWEARQ